MIEEFQGKNAFLSNFWPWYGKHQYGEPIVISYDGIAFPSVEHAYQAAKTNNRRVRLAISRASTPGYAKALGRNVLLRENFDNSRLDVMESLLRLKFFTRANWSEDLLRRLLETHPQRLQEGNYWGDEFWGKVKDQQGTWRGENHLGKLLMKLRREAWDVLDAD
jgi:N-glycosidase YbiA